MNRGKSRSFHDRSIVVGDVAVPQGGIVDAVQVGGEFIGAGLREEFGDMADFALRHGAMGALFAQPVRAVLSITNPKVNLKILAAFGRLAELGSVHDTHPEPVVFEGFLIALLVTIGFFTSVVAVLEEFFDAQADV